MMLSHKLPENVFKDSVHVLCLAIFIQLLIKRRNVQKQCVTCDSPLVTQVSTRQAQSGLSSVF